MLIIRRSKLYYTTSETSEWSKITKIQFYKLLNKNYCKTKFCASSWLITKINIRGRVSNKNLQQN
jgi:hypothetical protein